MADPTETPGWPSPLSDLLGDPALWADPPAGLEDQVVDSIVAEAPRPDRTARHESPPSAIGARVPRWLQVAAVVVLVAVGFAAGLAVADDDDPGPVADADAVVELAGSRLAPDASAVARIIDRPGGVVIRLDVTGLPPAPEGAYYQAWVRNAERAVSVGTFHLRGGDADIGLWSGVPIEDYPVITVTLEGDPSGATASDSSEPDSVMLRGELGE